MAQMMVEHVYGGTRVGQIFNIELVIYIKVKQTEDLGFPFVFIKNN